MRELRRVLFNRATLFMLVLLTAVGGVLFWLHTERSEVGEGYARLYTERYHELIEEYGQLSPEEISPEELDERADNATSISNLAGIIKFNGMSEMVMETIAEYPLFTEIYESGELQKFVEEPNLALAEAEALEALKEQIKYLVEFNAYYPSIKKNAERMQHTSIFGGINSFANRNVIKTVKDFAAIDGARGELGDDRAVTSVFDDPVADFLMLLFMAAASVIMLKERRSGLWHLVRATENGRARLALWRILTLFVCALLATVFIFGSRLIISYKTYDGMKYGARLIQSVQGYNGIPVPMSVNAFVGLYCGVKVVCTFFAGLLLYLLLSSIKNLNIAIAVTGAVLALEFALYSAVRDSSILVPFKYVNIFQLIIPRRFVVTYLNLNLFERPVNTRVAVSAAMGLVSLAAAIGIVLVHVFKRPTGKPNPIEGLLDRVRRRTYRCVFMQETGKALFAQRGILVIIVLVLIFLSFGSLPSPTLEDWQHQMGSYYRKYAGSVSELTLNALDEDRAHLEELIANETEDLLKVNYQDKLAGLEAMKEDVADIIARNASGEYPREIKLLPPYTYMILFGENSRAFEIKQGMKALLAIVLLTAGLYAYERQSAMTRLLRSLPRGRTRLFLRKELLTLAFTALVFVAVYLPEILAAADPLPNNGFAYFSYPVQGLLLLRESHLPLSVGGLTVLLYLVRFVSLFLVGSAVGLLSSLTNRVNTSLVLASAVFVLPACIVAMGVDALYDLTPLSLLWASGAMFYGEAVPFAVVAAVLLAMAAANCVLTCGKRTS